MHLETFAYASPSGWSVSEFPRLDSPQTLVIVFGASEFVDAPAPLQELRAAYPQSAMIGCSSSGEIRGTLVHDGSLSVAVAKFDHTELRTVVTPIGTPSDAASYAAGQAIAKALADPTLCSVLVLSDGLNVNGSKLVKGLNDHLPESVVVTGGLAGDAARFQRTWVLREGVPEPGYVSAVGLYGDRLVVGHGSKGGWDTFGPERKVTKSKANVLYELDNKPALEVYKTYLGDRAGGLPGTGLLFPLALRADDKDENSVVRTLLAIDEAAQSMTFAGDVPEGYLAQLMRANFDRLIEGASNAASMTQRRESQGDVLAIAISCVGRRLILGERTDEEIEATLDALPKGSKQVGFYSYGEISPFTDARCDLHNQTMTLTTIAER
jgi:hypothetical protein